MAVLDDLPALGGLQGLPGLRANLSVAAAAVLYGLVYPRSPKISTGTKVQLFAANHLIRTVPPQPQSPSGVNCGLGRPSYTPSLPPTHPLGPLMEAHCQCQVLRGCHMDAFLL